RMADDRIAATEIGQQPGTGVAGMRSLFPRVAVLAAKRDGAVVEGFMDDSQQSRRRAPGDLGFVEPAGAVRERTREVPGRGTRAVHFPVSGNQISHACSSASHVSRKDFASVDLIAPQRV